MSSTSLKLAGVAALYFLWLVAYWVFTDAVFGADHRYWAETAVVVLAAVVAFRNARLVKSPYSAFVVTISASLVLLAVTSSTYDPCAPLYPIWNGLELSTVSYAGFLYLWICAFAYLGIQLWRHRPPSTLTVVIFLVLTSGLAIICATFYLPAFTGALGSIPQRLDAAVAILEFAALTVGVGCVLLGIPSAINWMVFAMAVLTASDMLYAVEQSEHAVEPAWMSGLFLILATLIALPDELRRRRFEGEKPETRHESAWMPRSGLSAILILLSLGTLLLSVAVEVAIESGIHSSFDTQAVVQALPDSCETVPPHAAEPGTPDPKKAEAIAAATARKLFFSVVFVVLLVIAMVWITERFAETVEYLGNYATRLLRRRLVGEEWRETNPRVRTMLLSTSLGYFLDRLRQSAARLKQDVLFLGPERLFPPPRARQARHQQECFIVMPFSLEWSNEVHRIVSQACHQAGIRPVRGDDLFTPTDILDDIWQSINDADFVIADITDRNANVLYELGIAHTLAKPVLILSRTDGDIPIDLATRRVVVYGASDDDWRAKLEVQVSKAIAEMQRAYGSAGEDTGSDESLLQPPDASRGG